MTSKEKLRQTPISTQTAISSLMAWLRLAPWGRSLESHMISWTLHLTNLRETQLLHWAPYREGPKTHGFRKDMNQGDDKNVKYRKSWDRMGRLYCTCSIGKQIVTLVHQYEKVEFRYCTAGLSPIETESKYQTNKRSIYILFACRISRLLAGQDSKRRTRLWSLFYTIDCKRLQEYGLDYTIRWVFFNEPCI